MIRYISMRLIRVAATALLLGAGAALAQLPVVPGEPSLTRKDAAPTPTLRLAPKAVADVRLSPIDVTELAQMRRINGTNQKRLAVGVVRPIAIASWARCACATSRTAPRRGGLR